MYFKIGFGCVILHNIEIWYCNKNFIFFFIPLSLLQHKIILQRKYTSVIESTNKNFI